MITNSISKKKKRRLKSLKGSEGGGGAIKKRNRSKPRQEFASRRYDRSGTSAFDYLRLSHRSSNLDSHKAKVGKSENE